MTETWSLYRDKIDNLKSKAVSSNSELRDLVISSIHSYEEVSNFNENLQSSLDALLYELSLLEAKMEGKVGDILDSQFDDATHIEMSIRSIRCDIDESYTLYRNIIEETINER